MSSEASSGAFCALVLLAAVASAHPQGVHKRTVITVSAKSLEVLVTVDFDGGKRSELLRRSADADGDGRLDADEAGVLKRKLKDMVARPLWLDISTHRLHLTAVDAKLSLRGDERVSGEGLSVAVLFRADFPRQVTPGMTLTVKDASPDGSHVRVEVYQASSGDGGVEGQQREIMPGEAMTVRLSHVASPSPWFCRRGLLG